MKYYWKQNNYPLSKWEKINIARHVKKLAEDLWELDSLEPIDDVTEAKCLIDKIKKDLKNGD